MDQDVDMDAPQISTLREDESPSPHPHPAAATSSSGSAKTTTNPGFRLKLVVKDKTKTISSSGHRQRATPEEEDDEDQEDQLIDDDDAPIPPSSLASSPSKRKSASTSGSKKKARKSDHGHGGNSSKKVGGEDGLQGKLKEKVMQQVSMGAPNLAPTMSWFQANPTEHEDSGAEEGQISITGDDQDPPLSLPNPSTTKKKATSKKTPAVKKGKAGPTKLKLLPPTLLPPEDSGIMSEGMTGTAASSPVTANIEDSYSPEPEGLMSIPIDLAAPTNSATTATAPIDDAPINLENVPVPVYPLPTKPFPVLPPPKISTGFAPTIPLDKTKSKVRHWRVANREIRGIGGGRWFTRAWVGEKESEFASAMQAQKEKNEKEKGSTDGVVLPKLAGTAATAPVGGKGSKKKNAANLSRSGSSAPDGGGGGTSVSARGPSKMRISQMAPQPAPSSEAGDMDLAA